MQNYFIYKKKWHSVTKQQMHMHTADKSREYSFHKILREFQSDSNRQLSQTLTTTLTKGANIAQKFLLRPFVQSGWNGDQQRVMLNQTDVTKMKMQLATR